MLCGLPICCIINEFPVQKFLQLFKQDATPQNLLTSFAQEGGLLTKQKAICIITNINNISNDVLWMNTLQNNGPWGATGYQHETAGTFLVSALHSATSTAPPLIVGIFHHQT